MRIRASAIWHKGKIYEGDRHCDIGLKMLADGVCKKPYPGGNAQGFVTDAGEFVNREDALMIAKMAGQVKGKTCHPKQLFSEDLLAARRTTDFASSTTTPMSCTM